MTEHNDTVVDKTTSSRGAQWATAGSVIALAAQSLLGNNGGLLGNVLGGRGSGAGDAMVSALMSENAQLKADAKTDGKLVELYAALRAQDKAQDVNIYGLDKRVSALETAAPLREEILKGRISEVATLANNGISALQGQVSALAATVSGITKTVVPNTSVCPGWGSVTLTPAATTAVAA